VSSSLLILGPHAFSLKHDFLASYALLLVQETRSQVRFD
jgi:hypothetical protein